MPEGGCGRVSASEAEGPIQRGSGLGVVGGIPAPEVGIQLGSRRQSFPLPPQASSCDAVSWMRKASPTGSPPPISAASPSTIETSR